MPGNCMFESFRLFVLIFFVKVTVMSYCLPYIVKKRKYAIMINGDFFSSIEVVFGNVVII